jgi:outer membrane protein assembly factor BamB
VIPLGALRVTAAQGGTSLRVRVVTTAAGLASALAIHCGEPAGPVGPLVVAIASPTADDTVLLRDTVQLRAIVRDAGDREVVDPSVDWFAGRGRVLARGAVTHAVALDTGALLITARAGTATASVWLTVLPNSRPTVMLLTGPPARFYTTDTVLLVARAHDSEGPATIYWYSHLAGLLGTGDTLRWSPADRGGAGGHIFRIEARDGQGNQAVAVAIATVLPGERIRWSAGICAPRVGGGADPTVLSLADDGTLYLGSIFVGPCADTLRAVSPGGTVLWKYPVALWEHTSGVTVAPDGQVFILDYWGTAHALDSAGNLLWQRLVTVQDSHGRLALGPDGALFAGGLGAALMRLDPRTGSELWSIEDWEYQCGPTIAPDRTVTTQVRNRIEQYSPGGDLLRSITSPALLIYDCLAAMDWEGTQYLAVRTGRRIHAITAQGQLVWSHSLGSGQLGEPVVDADGTVYMAVGRGGTPARSDLLAIGPSGEKRWELTLAGSQYTPRLALLADRSLWLSTGAFLHHVSIAGVLLETIELAAEASSGLAVDADGTLYLVTDDGRLLAIGGDAPLAPDSPWPIWRRDNRRTASVPR